MRHIMFLKYRIDDLVGDGSITPKSISQLKQEVKILVIDDNEFAFLAPLSKYEFRMTQKNDLTTLDDAEAYDVILCDIRGVGKFLASDYDGAMLIQQLKGKYPEKIIVAYSADGYSLNYQKYLNCADRIVPKGDYGIEEWIELLQDIMQEMSNPQKQWLKLRDSLFDRGVSTGEVAEIESKYVESIKRGNSDSIKHVAIDDGVKRIIIDFIAAVVSKLVIG